MTTRNVVLTARNEALIEALVRSGRYQNASEVLRDGLRLIEQREAEEAEKLKTLKQLARAGLDSAARGEVRGFASVADLSKHLDGVAAKALKSGGRKRG